MIERKTIFSPDRFYRYTLWREWPVEDMLVGENSAETKTHKYVQFIGLNPSTADETKDDPTIRRCISFAKAWGYGAVCMTNLFAYRATDPRKMKSCPLPVGEENHHYLLQVASGADLIIAAWGTHGSFMHQDLTVYQWMTSAGFKLHCLGLTESGFPCHPLYLPANVKPIPFK